MEITVTRRWQAPDNAEFRASTTGVVSLDGQQVCFSLENTALIIPAGTYPVKLLMSGRFQRKTPHLLNVPGRTEIEIHGANHATDLTGCIGVAEHRANDYLIYESSPATQTIEEALAAAEANGETNTVTVTEAL